MLKDWVKRNNFKDFSMLSVFLLYIPLLFLGFGTDSDTYTALNAWNYFLKNNDYVPSRLPGYVIHEIGIYYATKYGDSFLSNLVTLLFAIVLCVFLIKLAKYYSIPTSSVLLVILNPVFIVNSTSTVDYVWALCFFVIGFYLLIQKKILCSSLTFAMASGIRLSYGLLILILFIYFFVIYYRENKRCVFSFLLGGLIILVINFAAYYLPLDFTQWKFSVFLNPSLGDSAMWSSLMRIGRWGYKNILLWGVPSVLFLAFLLMSKTKSFLRLWKTSYKGFLGILIALVITVEVLFFRFPIEIEYLLPMVPFIALLFGLLFKKQQWLVVLLSIMILINGFFSISIARPNIPNHATSAQLELSPVQGYLLTDIVTRQSFESNYHKTKNWWYAERMERLGKE